MSQNFVLMVSGQSNAIGRAHNPICDAKVAAYTFERTYIFKANAWEILSPADYTQSYGQLEGQHGVEPYLAYLFEQNNPNDKLYIIKYAVGGVSLAVDFAPHGTLYNTLVEDYIEPALATDELSCYTPLGFWWMQGESDSLDATQAADYLTNLKGFFEALESDVSAIAEFPKVIGTVRPNAVWTYQTLVRAAQYRYCVNNDLALIKTDDLAVNGGDDLVHYSAAGMALLGKRLFGAFFGMGAYLPPRPPYLSDTFDVELRGATSRATTPIFGKAWWVGSGRNIALTAAFYDVDTTGASGNLRVMNIPFMTPASGPDADRPRYVGVAQSYGLGIPDKNLIPYFGLGPDYLEFFSCADNAAWEPVAITAGEHKYLFVSIPIGF